MVFFWMMRGFFIFAAFFFLSLSFSLDAQEILDKKAPGVGPLVKKDERTVLVQTEYGEISAVGITDGIRGPYHLQFITLEPNSLFLPVLLHADMVFYVHTGSGTLNWADEDQMRNVDIRRGDIYMLHAGSLFYVQSSLEPERQKLRIHAIFSNTDDGIFEPSVGAYSRISDILMGFDKKVLQVAFKVPEDVIAEIKSSRKPPAIVHAVSKKQTTETALREMEARYLKSFLSGNNGINGKKKKPKTKTFNILDAEPDFKNCNGWSTTVNKDELSLLKDSNMGVFMVNLTKGSMMGPHWNPRATEIVIVLHGQGMIRVVCPGNLSESHCRDMRFRVEEGDIFAVPRFHPMAQMSFNNDSLVFMGFSTSTKRNNPQFLAGKSSLLQTLDRYALVVSFNVTNKTIDQLLATQVDSIILDCTSCAEVEESIMEEEIRRKKGEEEEAKRREEEAARRREEEKARKREEEEAKRREEEEAKRREEEEAQRREEEEARKREEEEAKRREEEEARKREEEEAQRREEEEARRREEEEEEVRRREEEARRRGEEEEEKEERQRREEEQRQEEERRGQAAAREQEEARREEKERERRAREEKEEARRKKEREERWRKEEEETGEPGRDEGGGVKVRRALIKVAKF